ncbi:MAG: septum formation initiator family protein [Verrucomicrobiae bacterium]|nr:septum formation initiator family protein [Verrucomicrobiae bacterium]
MRWRSLRLSAQSVGYWMFLGIVAAGAAVFFIPLWQRQRHLTNEIRRLEAEIARLEALERQYRSEIEALKTDPTYIERVAREKLNLVRPEETIFQFTPAATPTNPAVRRAP